MNVMEEAAQPAKEQRSHERYVEELAGPDDYWMTLTDSARATRRQEVTIRRWVASGELPVRRYRVGLNKRTRQVRASDLANLTPIIDTSAMISGEEGQLNLINIPAEQAAIRAEHQQMLNEVAGLREALAEYRQAIELAMEKHWERWQQALDVVQEVFNHRLTQHQQVIEGQQQMLEQVRTELLERLSRQEETAQQHQQQLEELRAALTAQGEHLQAYRHEVDGMLAKLRHEVEQHLETQGASITEAKETLARRLDSLGVRLEALEHTWQEQGKQQQQEMQTMRKQFQQEQEAITQQVAALATQIAEQQLHQEQARQQLLGQFARLQEQFVVPNQQRQHSGTERRLQEQKEGESTEH